MKKFISVLILLSACGCAIVPQSYFEYQQSFDETILRDYEARVEADEALLPMQKDNRLEAINVWRAINAEYVK